MFGHKKINRRLTNLETGLAQQENYLKAGAAGLGVVGLLGIAELVMTFKTSRAVKDNAEFIADYVSSQDEECP